MRSGRWMGAALAGLWGSAAMAQDFGNAMWFDGVNDQIVSTANFDTTRLTVEAWVYVIDLPQGSCGLAAWGRNSDAAWEVGLGEGSVAFAINWNKPTEKRFRADGVFHMQQWTHIAVTYDDTFARLYINGDLVHQSEFSMPIASAGVGASMALNNQFPGVNELGETIFDEVRIWSTARTESEIRCAMWHEIDPGTAGLMAYYRFNEALPGGQSVPDTSPAGRAAVLGASVSGGSDDPQRVLSSAPHRCLSTVSQPVSQLRGPGCSVALFHDVCGEGAITYQWYHGADAMPGETSALLELDGLTFDDAGAYTCVASNACGGEVSDSATLEVCIADFDCTGAVDGDDLLEYFGAWDQNDAVCDVDASGGVDGDDVIVFMGAWESGC